MSNLKPVEEVRLRNFLELQSRAGGHGAPTATHLATVLSEHGDKVTPTQLTSVYQRKKAISFSLASQVERALQLPQGWLSEGHEFLFTLTPAQLDVHNALAALPSEAKASISSLIIYLSRAIHSSATKPE